MLLVLESDSAYSFIIAAFELFPNNDAFQATLKVWNSSADSLSDSCAADLSCQLHKMKEVLTRHNKWRDEWNAVVASAHEAKEESLVDQLLEEYSRLLRFRPDLAWEHVFCARPAQKKRCTLTNDVMHKHFE